MDLTITTLMKLTKMRIKVAELPLPCQSLAKRGGVTGEHNVVQDQRNNKKLDHRVR